MKSCVVLCGGKGGRMGRDKGSLIIRGKPMLFHVLDTLENIVDDLVLVLGNQGQVERYKNILYTKNYENIHLRIYKDKIINQGPLGGILTGLLNIKSEYALVLPCDSPLISTDFILKMYEHSEKENFDAVIPQWDNGYIEPLHSIYKKEVTKIIDILLLQGKRDIRSLIGKLNVRYVNVKILDKTTNSFKNINTIEDYLSFNL